MHPPYYFFERKIEMFRPSIIKKRLVNLTANELNEMGITTLLLDVDNTLSTHHSQTPLEGVVSWLDEMKKQGIGLFLVSNAKEKRVAPFAKQLGIGYFSLCKKPLPFGIIRAIKRLNVPKSSVMLCGDQLFTDMPAGRLAGIKTLLVEPAQLESGWTFRVRRRLEKPLLRRYHQKENVQ